MELLLSMLILVVFVVGYMIWWAISNCVIELRYKNILLKEQNEILKEKI